MSLDFNNFKDKHYDESVFIFGNGPSLDIGSSCFERMKHIISMNRSWRKLEQPRYHCVVRNNNYLQEMLENKWNWQAADIIFYLGRQDTNQMFNGMDKELADAVGRKIDTSNFVFIKATEHRGFDLNQGHKVSNTGVFSIYVAFWLGFRRVYLLGYDCGRNEGHFSTGELEGRWANKHDKIFDRDLDAAHWNKIFGPEYLDPAIQESGEKFEIYNLNPNSRVTHFPYKSLEKALEEQ